LSLPPSLPVTSGTHSDSHDTPRISTSFFSTKISSPAFLDELVNTIARLPVTKSRRKFLLALFHLCRRADRKRIVPPASEKFVAPYFIAKNFLR